MMLYREKEVNILIIGNGMDISLGYLTKYADFLHFCKEFEKNFNLTIDAMEDNSILQRYSNFTIKKHDKNGNERIITNVFDKIIKKYHIMYIKKITKKFQCCVNNNWWIEYFQDRYSRNLIADENWIDIENEVRIVIDKLESKSDLRPVFGNISYNGKEICTNLIKILKSIDDSAQPTFSVDSYEQIKNVFVKKLRDDYDKFIAALGIYLNFFAFGIEAKTANIKQLQELSKKIRYILCFNYKDNYLSNYIEAEYVTDCMVHGSLNFNPDTEMSALISHNDMVVGFQDTKDNTKDLTFEYYRKYFQRIVNGTGNEYLAWFKDAETAGKKINVYVFGHSLDSTDKEILKPLFFFKDVHFTIYYYVGNSGENTDLEQKVTNLIKILGKENLIKFTSGENPVIRFEKQIEKRNNNVDFWLE